MKEHRGIVVCILLGSLLFGLSQGAKDRDCGEDYSPCNCSLSMSGDAVVYCLDVPVQEVQQVFKRTSTTRIFSFEWAIPEESMKSRVPFNFLNGRGDLNGSIHLICPTRSLPLLTDPSAFGDVKTVRISGCDVSQLTYQHLTNFEVVESLHFSNSSGILTLPDKKSVQRLQISSSPDLLSLADLNVPLLLGGLRYLGIERSPSFQQWDPSVQWSALESLSLYGNQLDDDAVQGFLSSILFTANSFLSFLDLGSNGLTRIPEEIRSFPRLSRIRLSDNNIQAITSGSFNFVGPWPVSLDFPFIDLDRNGLASIEPEAFQGNQSFTTITLTRNKLTKFHSAVFQPVLEQMIPGSSGAIDLYDNRIQCDCDLGWLLKDGRQYLPHVRNGSCSMGSVSRPLESITAEEFETEMCSKGKGGRPSSMHGPLLILMAPLLVMTFGQYKWSV